MKKEPTNAQITYMFFIGICIFFFGLPLFWVPYVGLGLIGTGALLIVLAVITIITKLFTKVRP